MIFPHTSLLSANGVHIINLVDDHVGLSFNSKNLLTNVYTNVTVLSSTFNIDHAYDGELFLLNYRKTPTKRLATLFSFVSSLSAGITHFNSTNFVDGDHLRLRNLGYI
jgi:UDP-N-acetylmuramyl pentapeptide phosphotransferase/UDP-N-acetylglucosamine-1-phosphate transferase